MKRQRSIRTRLLLALMLMTLLTLAISSGLSALMDLRLFRDHMLRDLGVLAAVIGDNCVSVLVFDSPESAERNLATLAREYQVRSATLFDARDQVFAHWQRDGAGVTRPIEVVHPLAFDGRPVGRLVLRVRLDELARQARLYAVSAGALALLTLGAALALALWLQRRIARPILELAATMGMVTERQDYRLRVSSPGVEREIATLVDGFNRMLGRIEAHETALEEANRMLRRLATELSLMEETEKARLAEELHDGPMQKLALAQMQIDGGTADLRLAEEAGGQLAAGLALMREAVGELRTLQFKLSPPVLHQRGLAAALHWLAADTRKRWGIDIACETEAAPPRLDRQRTLILYQCARELVNNLIKHSGARQARIRLVGDGERVELSVEDDGRGLNPSDLAPSRDANGGGYGLYSIRERVALLGGSLQIASASAGARLRVLLPDAGPTAPPPD